VINVDIITVMTTNTVSCSIFVSGDILERVDIFVLFLESLITNNCSRTKDVRMRQSKRYGIGTRRCGRAITLPCENENSSAEGINVASRNIQLRNWTIKQANEKKIDQLYAPSIEAFEIKGLRQNIKSLIDCQKDK